MSDQLPSFEGADSAHRARQPSGVRSRFARSACLGLALGVTPVTSAIFFVALSLPLFISFRLRWVFLFALLGFACSGATDVLANALGNDILNSQAMKLYGSRLANVPFLYLIRWHNTVVCGYLVLLTFSVPVAALLDVLLSAAVTKRTRSMALTETLRESSEAHIDPSPMQSDEIVFANIIAQVNELREVASSTACEVEDPTEFELPAIQAFEQSLAKTRQKQSMQIDACVHDKLLIDETLFRVEESLDQLSQFSDLIDAELSTPASTQESAPDQHEMQETISALRRELTPHIEAHEIRPPIVNSRHVGSGTLKVKETILDIIRFSDEKVREVSGTSMSSRNNQSHMGSSTNTTASSTKAFGTNTSDQLPTAGESTLLSPILNNLSLSSSEALPFLLGYLTGAKRLAEHAGEDQCDAS